MKKYRRAAALAGVTALSVYPFACLALAHYRLWLSGRRGTFLDLVFLIVELLYLLLFRDGLVRFGKYRQLAATAASLAGFFLGLGLLYFMLPIAG